MCEAERQLKMALYELDIQKGNGIWNPGAIRKILATEHEGCDHSTRNV